MSDSKWIAMSDAIAAEAIEIGMSLPEICDLFVGRVIAVALSRSNGNVSMAARSLGIHRNTLYNKLWSAR